MESSAAPGSTFRRVGLFVLCCTVALPKGPETITGEIPYEHKAGGNQLSRQIVESQYLYAHSHDQRIQTQAHQCGCKKLGHGIGIALMAAKCDAGVQEIVHDS